MKRNPNNIPGIHNYCDSWCERCIFTSRCGVTEIGKEIRAEIEIQKRIEKSQKENKEFWKQINEAIEDIADLIGDTNDEVEEPSKFDYFDDDDDEMDEHENHRKKASQQEISIISLKYEKSVDKWFDQVKDRFYPVFLPETKDFKIDNTNIDDISVLLKLSNAVEVIYWYQIQIHIKIQRALTSSYDDFESDPEFEEFPKDSDGSAKVALIGIDNSIGAWGTLHRYLENEKDETLNMLNMLKKLRNAVEREFPQARDFKRPGFDD